MWPVLEPLAFTFAGAALPAALNCFTSVLACALVGCEPVVLPILRTAVQNLLLLAAWFAAGLPQQWPGVPS